MGECPRSNLNYRRSGHRQCVMVLVWSSGLIFRRKGGVVESRLVKVRIDLFAGVGERAGADHVMLELQAQPDSTQITAQSVLDCLGQSCPSLLDFLPSCRLAVDCEYVSGETLVDVIQSDFALIPPVSGG